MNVVAVIGSGILGCQIAFQAAFHGKTVVLYDVDQNRLEQAHDKFDDLAAAYQHDIDASKLELDVAKARIRIISDLARAVSGAEIVIEAITEDLLIKRGFYRTLSSIVSPDTILATNSSTLKPSAIASAIIRPERFLALHFANRIWLHNSAEIMGHPGTDPVICDKVVEIARSIGMVTVPLYKEQPGYIVNSLLVPLLQSALSLAANGVADPETIDKTWMIATGAPRGPFAILDVIGMRTTYELASAGAEQGDTTLVAVAEWLKQTFIDENRLGVETGHGFYRYPNPSFLEPGFLKA